MPTTIALSEMGEPVSEEEANRQMKDLFDKNLKRIGDYNPMADDESGDEEDKIII